MYIVFDDFKIKSKKPHPSVQEINNWLYTLLIMGFELLQLSAVMINISISAQL